MEKVNKSFFDEEDIKDASASNFFDDEDVIKSDNTTQEPSTGETILHGATQGATLGFGEELGAGALATLQPLLKYIPGTTESTTQELEQQGFQIEAPDEQKSFIERYRDLRDTTREAQRVAKETNEGLYTLSEIAGGVAPALLTGGGSVAAGGVANLGLKELIKQGAKKGALSGLKYGAGAGLGTSEADLTKGETKQAAIDTLVGGGTGAVLGGGLGAAAPMLKAGASKSGELIDKYLTGEKSWLRDTSPSLDKIISATRRTMKGENLLGQKMSEQFSREMDTAISQLPTELKQIQNKIGSQLSRVIRKGEQSIDVTDDLISLESMLRREAAEAATAEGESQLTRLADRVQRQLKMKDNIVTGEQVAMQKAAKKRDAMMKDIEAKQSVIKKPKFSDPKVDGRRGQVYYTDHKGNVQKIVKYDPEAKDFNDIAKKYTKDAELLRNRHVEEKFQKMRADEHYSMFPDNELLAEADSKISPIQINPKTERIFTVDSDNGSMKQFVPKFKSLEAAKQDILEHKTDLIKKQNASFKASKLPPKFSEPKVDPTNSRITFQDLNTGKVHQIAIPKDTKIGKQILTGETKLNAEDLHKLSSAMGERLSSYEEGPIRNQAVELFKFFKEKTREALGDKFAEKEYNILNSRYSLLKQASEALKPGLSSGDKVTRDVAQRELANLADLLMVESNLPSKRLFRQFFDKMKQIDSSFVERNEKRIMDIADKIDINQAGLGHVGGISGDPSRLLTGTIEGLGVKGGVLAGKIGRNVKALTQLPKQMFLSAAEKARSIPGAGERVANILTEMANSDQTRRNALIFSASQNPAMKKILFDVLEEPTE